MSPWNLTFMFIYIASLGIIPVSLIKPFLRLFLESLTYSKSDSYVRTPGRVFRSIPTYRRREVIMHEVLSQERGLGGIIY